MTSESLDTNFRSAILRISYPLSLKITSSPSSTITDLFVFARKAGISKAHEISVLARDILEKGGLTTREGVESLMRFDRELQDSEHKLNPGTTADLTSAVLALHLLNGYRP